MNENYEEHGGRYKRSTDATHCAILNILSTGNVQDKVNGILFSASADDIDSLAEREYGYDLLPVEYWRTDETAYAYMFIARQGSKAAMSILHTRLWEMAHATSFIYRASSRI